MIRFLFAILPLLAANAIPRGTPEGMVLLGTMKRSRFLWTDYYADFQSRNWVAARSQCEGLFSNGNLVFIETESEYKFLKRQLEQHGSGRYYFIGSTFTKTKGWIWAGSEEKEIPDFILNATENIGRPFHGQDSIVLEYSGEYDSRFVVTSKSDTNPFICEVARTDSPFPVGCEMV